MTFKTKVDRLPARHSFISTSANTGYMVVNSILSYATQYFKIPVSSEQLFQKLYSGWFLKIALTLCQYSSRYIFISVTRSSSSSSQALLYCIILDNINPSNILPNHHLSLYSRSYHKYSTTNRKQSTIFPPFFTLGLLSMVAIMVFSFSVWFLPSNYGKCGIFTCSSQTRYFLFYMAAVDWTLNVGRPCMVVWLQKINSHCFVEWFNWLFYNNYVLNMSVIQCIYL